MFDHSYKNFRARKREYVTEKITENIKNPRDLWKNIKSLGLPSKSATESKISLKMTMVEYLLVQKKLQTNSKLSTQI